MINDLVCGVNLFAFFLIWSAVFLAPILPTKSRIRILLRLVTFFSGLFFFVILAAAVTPLSARYELLSTKVGNKITANIENEEKRG